jgi:hypothetical protein
LYPWGAWGSARCSARLTHIALGPVGLGLRRRQGPLGAIIIPKFLFVARPGLRPSGALIEVLMSVSSVEKGNTFEIRVFSILSQLLIDDKLFVSGKRSKIFQKKGYYSEARKKNIITDISIETYIDDADRWSLLTIIECKDYNISVPVNDIEEFKSKLDQIGDKNTKGIIATQYGFQEGTLNFASHLGIALIRILPNESIVWDSYRTTNTLVTKDRIDLQNEEIRNGLTDNTFLGNRNYCFCFSNNIVFNLFGFNSPQLCCAI